MNYHSVLQNLFICTTPLQLMIADNICMLESYRANLQHFVLIPASNSEKYNFYEKRMRQKGYKVTVLYGLKPFPFYLSYLKKIFRSNSYSSVYLASVDSAVVSTIISFCTFEKLFTFDDGTANIATNRYHKNKRYSKLKEAFIECVRHVLGVTYSEKKIASETIGHYTIYENFGSKPKNMIHLDLFKRNLVDDFEENVSANKYAEASVILGSVYSEIVCRRENINVLINRLGAFIRAELADTETTLLPHPRDEGRCISNLASTNSNLIAEDYIVKLGKSSGRLSVYGFASSCQFNFLGVKNIRVVMFESELLKKEFKELITLAESRGAEIINLDLYD